MVGMPLSFEERTEHLIKDRVLISQVLLCQLVCHLEPIEEDYAEGERRADQKNGDVHQVEVLGDVSRVALVGELRDREDAEDAEGQQNWAEANVHELCDVIDNSIEEFAVLVAEHERGSQHEAHSGGQNGIRCEDYAHSDLRLVALLVDVWLRG